MNNCYYTIEVRKAKKYARWKSFTDLEYDYETAKAIVNMDGVDDYEFRIKKHNTDEMVELSIFTA